MIRGVKGELKVRDVDLKKLANWNNRLELNDSIMTDKRISYASIDDTPHRIKSKTPGKYHDNSLENPNINYESERAQLELPPIAQKDLTKTPEVYSIWRKGVDLTSRESKPTNKSIGNESFDSKGSRTFKLKARVGGSLEKWHISPTFKT